MSVRSGLLRRHVGGADGLAGAQAKMAGDGAVEAGMVLLARGDPAEVVGGAEAVRREQRVDRDVEMAARPLRLDGLDGGLPGLVVVGDAALRLSHARLPPRAAASRRASRRATRRRRTAARSRQASRRARASPRHRTAAAPPPRCSKAR